MSEPVLRRATPRDLAALVALEEHFPGDRLSPRSFRRLLASAQADVLALEVAGQLLGNAIVLYRGETPCARLYSLVVAPQARGRGFGETLTRAAEAAARRRGCTRLRLEVRADNQTALGLYAKSGFVSIARLKDYYQDGGTGIRLEKSIPRNFSERPTRGAAPSTR